MSKWLWAIALGGLTVLVIVGSILGRKRLANRVLHSLRAKAKYELMREALGERMALDEIDRDYAEQMEALNAAEKQRAVEMRRAGRVGDLAQWLDRLSE